MLFPTIVSASFLLVLAKGPEDNRAGPVTSISPALSWALFEITRQQTKVGGKSQGILRAEATNLRTT